MEFLKSCQPLLILFGARSLQGEIKGAALGGFYFEYMRFFVDLVGDFLDLEVLEREELDVFLIGLLHMHQPNTTQHVEARLPAFIKRIPFFEQEPHFVSHQIIS